MLLKKHAGVVVASRTTPRLIGSGLFPTKLLDAAGAKKPMSMHEGIAALATPPAADGDEFYWYFWSRDGTETKLCLTTIQYGVAGLFAFSGIFDIYLNGVLDSAGYDDYNTTYTIMNRYISLVHPVLIGENVIKLKINGKNASSSAYFVMIVGMSVQ